MIKYTVEIKQYHDKVNGNTYFSARAHDLDGKIVAYIPFQYGYGSHAERVTEKELNCKPEDIRAFYSDNTQASVKAWGHEIKGPYRVIFNRKGHTLATMPEVYALMDTAREYDIKVKDASGNVFLQRKGA
jgi:hypothetical protein